ncbi:MAG TPA: fibronectin type III domain-containing protein [Acidimicrobiales bacterium]|nr:fibronectin type III domain-containing protein [Acidimicrobiales bacterium]
MTTGLQRGVRRGLAAALIILPAGVATGIGATEASATPALPAAPATVDEVVSPSGNTTGGNCGPGLDYSGTVYTTIGAAVTAAGPGDTIYVCAGTYPERVTMNKPLTLDGVQWSVPANTADVRTNPSAESTISTPTPNTRAEVTYTVDGSTPWTTTPTLSGFTLQGPGTGSETTHAISRGIEAAQSNTDFTTGIPHPTSGEGSGYVWTNNIIQKTAGAITFQSTGYGDNTTEISGNRFTDNNSSYRVPGGSTFSGSAVYVNDGPAITATISDNLFEYHDGNAINTSGRPTYGTTKNFTVEDNTSLDDVNFLFVTQATTTTASGNTVTWDTTPLGGTCDVAWQGAIAIAGANDGATVSGNTVTVADGVQQTFPTLTPVQATTCRTMAAGSEAFGILVSNVWNPASTNVSVTGNHVTGAYDGILATAQGGPYEWYCAGNPGTHPTPTTPTHHTAGPCGYGDNTGFTISDNVIAGSPGHGLWLNDGTPTVGTNAGFTLTGNVISASGVADCEDDTTDSGTAGTANTWTDDRGPISVPAGICPSAPDAPTGVTAIAPSSSSLVNQAVVSWTAPDDHGSPITSYTVVPTDQTTGTQTATVTVTGSATSATVGGLVGGDRYVFSVTAVNAVGTGPSATSNAVVPVKVAPTASSNSGTTIPDTGTATVPPITTPSGGTGTAPVTITASATGTPGATGTLTISVYPSNPVAGFVVGSSFFDVSVSPDSSFTTVSFDVCGIPPGQVVQWWDPIAQTFSPASDQSAPTGSPPCVTVTLTATTTPSIADLYGTVFATAAPASAPQAGYWQVAGDGGVFAFGSARFYGSMAGTPLSAPIVGIAPTPDDGGYWEVAADGGVFAFGDAGFYGSLRTGVSSVHDIVGLAAAPTGKGYWLVGADGGVFAFGSASFSGSLPARGITVHDVVGMAATPTGKGYWLVGSDGGVFALGGARFSGSMGGKALNAPVVGVAAAPTGKGYWLAGADGGVFAFGSAGFSGSMGGTALNAPVVGVAAAPVTGTGYWLAGSDGGVFSFGSAAFYGSMGGKPLNAPIVGVAAT